MFKNYLLTAIRNLSRQKLYTAINIFGLAIGLSLCLFTLGYICHELQFEDCHKNKDNIYRVETRYNFEKTDFQSASVMAPFGFTLKNDLPEVEDVAIFRNFDNILVEKDKKFFDYEKMTVATPGFLKVFTIPLLVGESKNILNEPNKLVVSQKIVNELYGGINPVGQLLRINNTFDCEIAGIMENIPQTTQMFCDFILSYPSLKSNNFEVDSWENFQNDYVYFALNKNADPYLVEGKLQDVLESHTSPEISSRFTMSMKALKEIYFYSHCSGEIGPIGEISLMFEFGVIALLMLILAITNFVNLATARTAKRINEVGVRKVFGANRLQLIRQFIGESLLLTTLAMALGITIYEIFKLWIQDKLPREMLANYYDSSLMVISIILLTLIVGVLSGFYPALYLSRHKPISILNKVAGIKSTKSILRKVLVVLQFTIAITFIAATTIMNRQFKYISAYDLGFEKDNMLIVKFETDNPSDDIKIFKNELFKNGISNQITAVETPLGQSDHSYYALYKDSELEERIKLKAFFGDVDFLSTYNLEMAQGEWFSEEKISEMKRATVITENTAKQLGYDNPIGQKIYSRNGFFEIIGVVKDFYGTSLNHSFTDLTMIRIDEKEFNYLVMKLPDNSIESSLSDVRALWDKFHPDAPFRYSFVDDEISKSYSDMRGMVKAFSVISFLTIFIASLGIFGLTSFTAEQRTKEIGIRKVLGASSSEIIVMLNREFLLLIGISNLIAWPLAYFMIQDFFKYHAVRVNIGIGTFLFAGLIALLITVLTTAFQAYKAASINPVKSLRHE